jgi:hypothetical protein
VEPVGVHEAALTHDPGDVLHVVETIINHWFAVHGEEGRMQVQSDDPAAHADGADLVIAQTPLVLLQSLQECSER